MDQHLPGKGERQHPFARGDARGGRLRMRGVFVARMRRGARGQRERACEGGVRRIDAKEPREEAVRWSRAMERCEGPIRRTDTKTRFARAV